jgi:hypothetical protein
MTSGGIAVGFEKIIYATIPPPTTTMASTLNLKPVHFLELDLAPCLPQQLLYFFPLPQGQGSFCRIFDDIFLNSFFAPPVIEANTPLKHKHLRQNI